MAVYQIEGDTVKAEIDSFGCMTDAVFRLPGKSVQPFYRPAWEKNAAGDPFHAHLHGDFFCVPFGKTPDNPRYYPAQWGNLIQKSPIPEYQHGFSSNADWSLLEKKESEAKFYLDYSASNVSRLERHVNCSGKNTLSFRDSIFMAREARLSPGLHPIFKLPERTGTARLILPEFEFLATAPAPVDASSVLQNNIVFSSLREAPLSGGGTLDATRLPWPPRTEEVVMLCNVKEPVIILENHEDGYRVTLRWDGQHLKHCLLWFSNRGRVHPPWNGQNLCIGIEPITAAFDLGQAVSTAANPLEKIHGISTSLHVSVGKTTIWHTVMVENL